MHEPIASTVPVPIEKLSYWRFAVSHAMWALEQRIEVAKERGYNSDYDKTHLKSLQDLEMFMVMSWDKWLDDTNTQIRELQVALGEHNG